MKNQGEECQLDMNMKSMPDATGQAKKGFENQSVVLTLHGT